MMALGAITLIALVLPGEGALTDWWRDSIAPWFETGRWLLPFLLLAGGWWIAAGPGKKAGSGLGDDPGRARASRTSPALGAFEILAHRPVRRRARRRPHRALPRGDAGAAAHRPGRDRAAGGDRRCSG